MKAQHWTTYLLAFSAVSGTLVACFWGWRNHKSKCKHDRLSLKPHLGSTFRTDEKKGRVGEMAFVIENQGMGMGIIKTTTFFADGKEFTAGDHFDRARLLFHEYIAQAPCNRDVEFVHGNSMGIDQAMRPGSACELLRVKFKTPRSADSAKEFRDFLIRHFRVKIHCLSLYEEDCSYDSAGGN